jgi:hypothetical protein
MYRILKKLGSNERKDHCNIREQSPIDFKTNSMVSMFC